MGVGGWLGHLQPLSPPPPCPPGVFAALCWHLQPPARDPPLAAWHRLCCDQCPEVPLKWDPHPRGGGGFRPRYAPQKKHPNKPNNHDPSQRPDVSHGLAVGVWRPWTMANTSVVRGGCACFGADSQSASCFTGRGALRRWCHNHRAGHVTWEEGRGGGAHPQYANYWAPLTRKRRTMPHSAQSQHANYWAPRTRKRHQQEHRPQRPTERSDPTQHAKGRTGDRPGPRKGATTRRNVTLGGGALVRRMAMMEQVLMIRGGLRRAVILEPSCDGPGLPK